MRGTSAAPGKVQVSAKGRVSVDVVPREEDDMIRDAAAIAEELRVSTTLRQLVGAMETKPAACEEEAAGMRGFQSVGGADKGLGLGNGMSVGVGMRGALTAATGDCGRGWIRSETEDGVTS
jgi:hypothetical protein